MGSIFRSASRFCFCDRSSVIVLLLIVPVLIVLVLIVGSFPPFQLGAGEELDTVQGTPIFSMPYAKPERFLRRVPDERFVAPCDSSLKRLRDA